MPTDPVDMLCATLRAVEAMPNGYGFLMNNLRADVRKWWFKHKDFDNERRRKEALERFELAKARYGSQDYV